MRFPTRYRGVGEPGTLVQIRLSSGTSGIPTGIMLALAAERLPASLPRCPPVPPPGRFS